MKKHKTWHNFNKFRYAAEKWEWARRVDGLGGMDGTGRIDRREEWLGRERWLTIRVDRAGRVDKTGTADGAGRVAQLFLFVRLLTFETLYWVLEHFVIHSSLLVHVICIDNQLNSPLPRRTLLFLTGNFWLLSIFFQCKKAITSNIKLPYLDIHWFGIHVDTVFLYLQDWGLIFTLIVWKLVCLYVANSMWISSWAYMLRCLSGLFSHGVLHIVGTGFHFSWNTTLFISRLHASSWKCFAQITHDAIGIHSFMLVNLIHFCSNSGFQNG